MALAAFCAKGAVLLLLIILFLLLLLFVWFCVRSWFWYAVLCVLSSIVNLGN